MKRRLNIAGALLVLCALRAAPSLAQDAQDAAGTEAVATQIVGGARAQIGNPYDASYVRIPYPNGDIPGGRGLCADVVVRALRAAGYDLQQLIHEDRKLHFREYPRTWGWGRKGPDANSDHRVNENQMFYFSRFGTTLTTELSPRTVDQWQPGDIVYWKSGSPLGHAGVVSDEVSDDGVPLVIHTGDKAVVEDNSLMRWPIVGHFRFPPAPNEGNTTDTQEDE